MIGKLKAYVRRTRFLQTCKRFDEDIAKAATPSDAFKLSKAKAAYIAQNIDRATASGLKVRAAR